MAMSPDAEALAAEHATLVTTIEEPGPPNRKGLIRQ